MQSWLLFVNQRKQLVCGLRVTADGIQDARHITHYEGGLQKTSRFARWTQNGVHQSTVRGNQVSLRQQPGIPRQDFQRRSSHFCCDETNRLDQMPVADFADPDGRLGAGHLGLPGFKE